MVCTKILSIAGSDSGGGAGIQADIKTIFSLGCYASTAITAITAQNTSKVDNVFKIPAEIVCAQIRSVLSDIKISAIKIGMIPDGEIASAVADVLPSGIPIILDPVMISTSGHILSTDTAVLISALIPKALVVTPNIPEAEILSGLRINNISDMIEAGRIIIAMGPENVLIKGGHLLQHNSTDITNILVTKNGFVEISNVRTSTYSLHGTGCTLSTALACFLAKTNDVLISVKLAIEYVQNSASISEPIGNGHIPIQQIYQKLP